MKSPKLTEGLFYNRIDIFANASEIPVYFNIGNPDYFQIVGFQKSRAFCIFFNIVVFVVLGTIQFYHQSCFRTVKIRNISSEHLLP